jgi:hypothetical protein
MIGMEREQWWGVDKNQMDNYLDKPRWIREKIEIASNKRSQICSYITLANRNIGMDVID